MPTPTPCTGEGARGQGGVEQGHTGKVKLREHYIFLFHGPQQEAGNTRPLGLPPFSIWKLRGPEELTLDSRNFCIMHLSPPGKKLYWEKEWVSRCCLLAVLP